MNRHLLNVLAACLIVTMTAVVWNSTGSSSAQESKSQVKEGKDPKGRLPDYYAEVVDGLQREKIYKIQAEYAPEIKKLEEQIAKIESKMEKDIDAVLRPDQRERVAQRRAAAETKRRKQRESNTK